MLFLFRVFNGIKFYLRNLLLSKLRAKFVGEKSMTTEVSM